MLTAATRRLEEDCSGENRQRHLRCLCSRFRNAFELTLDPAAKPPSATSLGGRRSRVRRGSAAGDEILVKVIARPPREQTHWAEDRTCLSGSRPRVHRV